MLVLAIFLLACFFLTIYCTIFYPNNRYHITFSNFAIWDWIFEIIIFIIFPTTIFLFYRRSEKWFSFFVDFLSNRFCSYLADEELFYLHATNDSEQENYSDYTESNINLFSGVHNIDDLQKRYRELLEIYHPNEAMANQIQAEYEQLLEYFSASHNLGQIISFDKYRK